MKLQFKIKSPGSLGRKGNGLIKYYSFKYQISFHIGKTEITDEWKACI